jgi:GNAT superfamily N-acetyltransferase
MEDAVIRLPETLTERPATTDDLDAITELIGACEAHDAGRAEIDRDDVEAGFGRSGFDPSRDTLLVHEGNTLVAWAEVYQNRAEADVRPSHRGRGLGTALLAWTEELARAHGEHKVSQTVIDANAGAAALFAANGYEPTRTAWFLEIVFGDAKPPVPDPPEDISIRPYDTSLDERAVYQLIDDAFSEWEGRDPIPFEEWAPYVIRHPSFSSAMSPLAFDGHELVGAVMSFDYASANEGWIHQLATKATHRHRGIARTLLHTAFRAFHEHGKRSTGLSTDSRTGALSLYERVGMSVRSSYTRFTKVFG